MFCPQCRSEYRPGFSQCSDCNVSLVSVLPPEPEPEYIHFEKILATNNPGEIALIKSLLEEEKIIYLINGENAPFGMIGVDPLTLMVEKEQADFVRELLREAGFSLRER